jgi:hypothetical protein
MPPTQRKRPGDLTGRTVERQNEENKEALLAREAEISLTNQAKAAAKEGVIDVDTGFEDPDAVDENDNEPGDGLTAPPAAVVAPSAPPVQRQPESVVHPAEVTHTPDVTVEKPRVTFRVNSDVENMTYGAGTNYTFKEGQRYSGTQDLYNHLDSIGLIYH